MENVPVNVIFQTELKESFFLLLGSIYFSLLMYWLHTLRTEEGRSWIWFSLFSGFGFGAIATYEWGASLAGTGFSLGICLSLALMDAGVAACLLASSLFLRPWEMIADDRLLALLPRLSFLLCIGHLFLFYAREGRIKLVANQTTLAIIGFAIWCFITTLFAPDPALSQSAFFNGLLKSLFLYLIIIQMIRDRADLKRMVITLVMSFLFVASLSVYKTLELSAIESKLGDRLQGFGAFKNSNDIAALMVFILPFAFVYARRRTESMIVRIVCGTLGLVALVTIALSRSRGAIVAVGAMFALHYALKLGKRALVPVAVGAACLALPATMLVSGRTESDLEGSSAGRITYLKAGLRMGLKHPVFGVGFDAYPASLLRYSTESLEESQKMTAHNSWLLVFAETGFIGLFLFTSVFVFMVQAAFRIYTRQPEFLLAMTGYGVVIFFLSHSYVIYLYLLYALVQSASSFRRARA